MPGDDAGRRARSRTSPSSARPSARSCRRPSPSRCLSADETEAGLESAAQPRTRSTRAIPRRRERGSLHQHAACEAGTAGQPRCSPSPSPSGSLGISLAAGWSPKLGLDLAGGLSVVYQPQGHPSQADLNETVLDPHQPRRLARRLGRPGHHPGQDIVVSVPGRQERARGPRRHRARRPSCSSDRSSATPRASSGRSSKDAAPAGTPTPTTCQSQYLLNASNLNVTVDPRPRRATSSTTSVRTPASPPTRRRSPSTTRPERATC